MERQGHPAVADAARTVLACLREEISAEHLDSAALDLALVGLPQAVERQLQQSLSYSLRPVINATGVILHTNLGRAPLASSAFEHLREIATSYSNLELDLTRGERGKRDVHVDQFFRRLLHDEMGGARPPEISTIVVNNNAAAVLLALNTLAEGGEVIVSRGELVEIGGSFRVPDVMAKSNAVLREVGTTNRTSVADYRAAIGPQTAFLLKVHTSNYRIEGFTAEASIAELAGLGVPVVADIGSGLLAPSPVLPGEPDADSTLRAGAALVTASGDKLLGGPQAGLLLGQDDLVRRLTRHPLARALRVDKLTLAALEATLAGPHPPAERALAADAAAVMQRAEDMAARLAALGIDARAVPCQAAVGGGGAPGLRLPSAAVSLPPGLAAPLRAGQPVRRGDAPAVLGRVTSGRLLLDLRAVAGEDDDLVCAAVTAAARG